MKKTKILFTLATLFVVTSTTAFASWSNYATATYYRDGYTWGWDEGLNNVTRQNSSTGESVYASFNHSNKTSITDPKVTLINTNKTYRSKSVALKNSSASDTRAFGVTAPKGESLNVLIQGNALQQGADTVRLQFNPY